MVAARDTLMVRPFDAVSWESSKVAPANAQPAGIVGSVNCTRAR